VSSESEGSTWPPGLRWAPYSLQVMYRRTGVQLDKVEHSDNDRIRHLFHREGLTSTSLIRARRLKRARTGRRDP
jgi:hypothetical protein